MAPFHFFARSRPNFFPSFFWDDLGVKYWWYSDPSHINTGGLSINHKKRLGGSTEATIVDVLGTMALLTKAMAHWT